MRPISYLHGEPRIVWDEEEVTHMIYKENLQYAVIWKFSYGMPEIKELRKIIPKQCELKGECNIELLGTRHVFIRAEIMEDYVKLLSKPVFYLTQRQWSYPMRTLKWDPMFDPEEETTTAIAWISFPGLPPIFFVKEAIFSLAAAVGKPLQVDMATKNQTRPSCARVKVEVNLQGEFPKRINIGVRKQSGEVVEKWIRIKYDYVPKYCVTCRLQGHNEQECYALHPELYPKKNEASMEIELEKQENKGHKEMGHTRTDGGKVKSREKGETEQAREQFHEQRNRRNHTILRYNEHRASTQVWNPKPKLMEKEKEGWKLNDQFEALKDPDQIEETSNTKVEVSTRKWVEDNFTSHEALGKSSVDHEKENDGQGIDDKTQNKQGEDTMFLNRNEGKEITLWDPEKERNKESTPDPLCIVESKSGDKSIPYIHELTPTQKQRYQEEREDDDMEMNIQSASKAGDLSPRQMEELKSGYKKNMIMHTIIPLQVKTRRSKEKGNIITQ
ncbi:hypothetical protein MTR67_008635 [Solanum verrucosum]|uniref:DUF4283 domain-containing protein n=1 Tax=Solanum verrucosum TaxID=315347 RepID=A0AAF0TJI6_SOLVR|nr:hypothetical protein MTR67_008635 [Solanum verrucosum]